MKYVNSAKNINKNAIPNMMYAFEYTPDPEYLLEVMNAKIDTEIGIPIEKPQINESELSR